MKTEYDYNSITKEELFKIVNQQAKQIQYLEEQILAYQLRQFANKSEKINPNQGSLFDEACLPTSFETVLAQEQAITVASYSRNKNSGRKPLPREFPRIPRIYDLPENEKVCKCGCELTPSKMRRANS